MKTESLKQEKELAKRLGAKLTAASGATPFSKGDMYTDKYLIESKATEKASLSVKKEWLEKIEVEAIRAGKTPLLVITLAGRTYFVFRDKDVDLHAE